MQRKKPNHHNNSNFPMNSARQLIDSLTSHLSLYHASSPNSNPNPHPRSSIIKWFSSLTVHQRQAQLTAVDLKFTQTLLEMLHKLRTSGHGFFFILSDVPCDHRRASASISLPSLLFRKSHGLLSRVAESNESEQAIREAMRLFSSEEGENANDFSRSRGDDCVDSITVSEEFVEDVERFVEVMDGVSNGGFLRGEESGGLAAEWPELEWLKAKGYCSMETFVANRLEVALRLGWLNCSNSGKKRGVKLKEKINGAGVAANVFGRKMGCIYWWRKLDEATKKKIFRLVVGKAAKLLTAETSKGKNVFENELLLNLNSEQPLGYNTSLLQRENDVHPPVPDSKAEVRASVSVPFQLKCMFSSLILLEDIFSKLLVFQHRGYDEDKLFFSSLESVNTTSDLILRKFRDILMVVSLDCTKLELLEEEKLSSSTKKQKEKLGTSNHKKKGKNRNSKKHHSAARSSELDKSLPEPAKENGAGLPCKRIYSFSPSSRVSEEVQERNPSRECLVSGIDMGCNNGLNDGNLQSASRKSKKGRNKLRSSSTHSSVEIGSGQRREVKAILHGHDGNGESDCILEHPIIDNAYEATGNDRLERNSSNSIALKSLTSEYCEGSNDRGFSNSLNSGNVMITDGAVACLDSIKGNVKCEAAPSMPTRHLIDDPGSAETKRSSCKHQDEVERKSRLLTKLRKDNNFNGKATPPREQGISGVYDTGIINSSAYLSYEWPTIAPIQIPPCNSHLPAATDRLHLDVGYNWQNHFHQSFVPAVHRVRNSPVENGCSGITSRPLPMSLDWPPMVRGINGIAPSVVCNYDPGFISRRQSSFHQGFSASGVHCGMMTAEDERVCSSDVIDFSDPTNLHELADDQDNQWMSEEELEVHAVSGMDCNQYFGGGVMYWNPSDFPGSSFSRPPSLSSDDSSWAWREADMNRAVDDIVAFSSSYSTNGLTSPSAASFCSPFDPLGPSHQAVGYVLSENEISGKVLPPSTMTDVVTDDNASGSLSSLSGDCEAKTGDSLQYPILRPIIIPNIPREIPKSDFIRNLDRKSPCIPPNSREQPRIKRPPSPVVLCVPRAPRPPPPSPVGDSRKLRGFPSVRSGSSSPRHWGVKGGSHDGINFEEACIRMGGSEVVWPSWRNKSLQARKLTQPVPGALLQDRLIAISQLARDQEHPDVAFPLQPPELLNCSMNKASLSVIHSLLHDEIDSFCNQVASENLTRKPSINWAVKRVTRSLQVLWPRSRTNIFGSNATGLSLPSSDVDLVVCLPPVRNLEPIKEAGILEGRNGIKETCLQHAARYLANQEWVKNDSLKIVENTAIPIIMLVVEVPQDLIATSASNGQAPKEPPVQDTGKENNSFQGDPIGSETSASIKFCQMKDELEKDVKSVRIDISFKSPSHTGLQTTELVKELTEQFPAATPLALVLKKFLADRSLDQSYSGGLSSYCLVLLIIRFLQHEHHLGRSISENYGSLLMDFLYFFGNVFDPRQMRISVQGSGVYITREQGCSIDPIYIDDPLFPANNVGRNCFRIHQCIKAFADAYSTLENEFICLPNTDESNTKPACKLLQKIIPSFGHSGGS